MRTSILGKVHFVASKYDPETRAKAVRLVLEHRDDYPSEWAAITAVSKRLGMTAETLRSWIRQHQVDDGQRDGVSSEAAAEIRALKRRNAELDEPPRDVRRLHFLGGLESWQVVRRGGIRRSCVSGACVWSPRSAFSRISPHFRPRRHLLSANGWRHEMADRFTGWNEITGVTTTAV